MSTGGESHVPENIGLGTFAVIGSSAEAERFSRATGACPCGGTLPLTFPICWLVTPSVRAAMLGIVSAPDMILVHESQSFAYGQALRVDTPYDLTLTARRVSAPDRLFVDGLVRDAAGVVHAGLETTLRLVAVPAA